jgi:Spy/CpxP family protein refolding chaperone
MSDNELNVAAKPTRYLRGILYATALLVGGGVIGAAVVGPTLGQGYGQGGGAGPDGPRWHRFMQGQHEMDRQQDRDDGPGWRRGFGWRRGGMQQNEDGHGMGRRTGGGFASMMSPGVIERRVNRVLGVVDASTEQKQKVRAVFEKAANDLYAMRNKRTENRRAMAEALAAATIDRAKVEQLRTDRMKLADASSKRLTDAVVEAAEVLTPAQRADLAARFQRRRGG